MNNKKHALTVKFATILVSLLFLYASIAKMIEYSTFKLEIQENPLLAPSENIVAITLISLELLSVLLLNVPKYRSVGLYTAIILLVSFTVYIINIEFTQKGIPCACGGIIESLSRKQHILFNVVFIAITGIGIHSQSKLTPHKKTKSSAMMV